MAKKPKRVTARDLDDDEPGSTGGPVEINGYLMFTSPSEPGWIAADIENPKPVVMLDNSAELFEALQETVSMWGGGPFLYCDQVAIVGTLTSVESGYLLTAISTIEIRDDTELGKQILDLTQDC